MRRWCWSTLYEILSRIGEEWGPYGHCVHCGGPVDVPYVIDDCPRRPLFRRLAFQVLCWLDFAGGFEGLRHGQLRMVRRP